MLGDNVAEVALTADISRLASGLRAAARMVNDFGSGANASMGRFTPRDPGKKNWLAHVGGQAAGNLMGRGIDFFVDQGKAVMNFEEQLVRLGIAAKLSGAQLNDIRTAARATSTATGIDASVVIDSYRAYIDLAGAQNGSITKMNLLAKAGQATGAEGKDLAGMMYQLTRSMKVTDAQMEDTMGGLINQAKDGAVEAKQMAAEFSSMMPIFARFGVTGREGAIQLGAMFQVTRDGFDSASQAATGMVRLMAGLQRHASRFAEHGVQVFKPGSKSELRQMSDIMQQIKRSDLSKDTEALVKAFGRSEAWRTFKLLEEAPERLAELERAGRANGVIMQDLGTYTESSAGKMAISMEKMKNSVAIAFTPERIEQFAKAMEAVAAVVNKIAQGISFVADKIEEATHGTENEAEKKVKEQVEAMAKMSPQDRAFAIRAMQQQANKIEALGDKGGLEGRQNEGFLKGVSKYLTKNMLAESDSWIGHNMHAGTGDPWAVADAAKEQFSKDPAAAAREKKFSDENRDYALKILPAEIAKALVAALEASKYRKDVAVNIDGNPVAKASDNATDRRRK